MVRSSLVVALVAACGGGSPRPGTATPRHTSEITAPPAEIVAGRAGARDAGDVATDAGERLPADGLGAGSVGVGGGGLGNNPGPSQVPIVRVGAPATGQPDKEVVRRVVRQHIGEIRTCYETTLLQQPDLAGTVVATFTIAPDGSVSRASASGLHPDVEGCIAARISTWTFPAPTGGGALYINYPFVLRQES